jgi:hypothetical protein
MPLRLRTTLEQRALEGFRSLGLSFEVVSEQAAPPLSQSRIHPQLLTPFRLQLTL